MKFIKVIAILCIIWCSELVCEDSEEYDYERREIIVYGGAGDEPHGGGHRERIEIRTFNVLISFCNFHYFISICEFVFKGRDWDRDAVKTLRKLKEHHDIRPKGQQSFEKYGTHKTYDSPEAFEVVHEKSDKHEIQGGRRFTVGNYGE